MRVRRALLSVSDKRGLVELARALRAHGVDLLSTGGTHAALVQAGLPVTQVSDFTGAPEILDGRVKTLHPRIHGGLLGRPVPAHEAQMAAHGIEPIDLVVVNLYPFEATVARDQVAFADAIEQIDIGGPAMLRSAAKNHERVAVVVDPDDYPAIIAELEAGGGALSAPRRLALARKVYAHTSAYDAAIAAYLSAVDDEAALAPAAAPAREGRRTGCRSWDWPALARPPCPNLWTGQARRHAASAVLRGPRALRGLRARDALPSTRAPAGCCSRWVPRWRSRRVRPPKDWRSPGSAPAASQRAPRPRPAAVSGRRRRPARQLLPRSARRGP